MKKYIQPKTSLMVCSLYQVVCASGGGTLPSLPPNPGA